MNAICKLAEVISDIEVAKPANSAIEYIVENPRPGEVIFIRDEDYYNYQLWSSYITARAPERTTPLDNYTLRWLRWATAGMD